MSLNLAEIILKAVAAKTDIILRYENGSLQVKVFNPRDSRPVLGGQTLLPKEKVDLTTPDKADMTRCTPRIQPIGDNTMAFVGSVKYGTETSTISGMSNLDTLRERVGAQTDPYQFLQHLLNFADGAQLPKPGGQVLSSF